MLADGCNVRLLVRNAERARTRLGPDFQYPAGNVDDPDAVKRVLEGCCCANLSTSKKRQPYTSHFL